MSNISSEFEIWVKISIAGIYTKISANVRKEHKFLKYVVEFQSLNQIERIVEYY